MKICQLHKNLSSIPYAEEVTGDHQCGFQSSRSTTDIHIFCFRQILEKNGNEKKQYISYLYISRKTMNQLQVRNCIKFSLSLVNR